MDRTPNKIIKHGRQRCWRRLIQTLEGKVGKKLNPEQMELYRATDEVLHYIWDPIGVANVPNARDEYWGYLPQVFRMLVNYEPDAKIVEYLVTIETERMGLNSNKRKAEKVVEILNEHKEKISQNAF